MGKKDRVGEVRRNKKELGNYEMKIVEYIDNKHITIEFQDEYKIRRDTTYQNFQNGSVKNPYHSSICGVGYEGVGKYSFEKNKKAKEHFKSMIRRGYDLKFKEKNPTYMDAIVAKEWYNFQVFAEWYYENYYEVSNETMCLDKDILVKGNKVYSPDTCIFAPEAINLLFTKNDASRGEYPIGCDYRKATGKIRVRCKIFNTETGKSKEEHLGYFPNTEEGIMQAFLTYKHAKENNLKTVAEYYKDLIPNILYEALMNYEVEITD